VEKLISRAPRALRPMSPTTQGQGHHCQKNDVVIYVFALCHIAGHGTFSQKKEINKNLRMFFFEENKEQFF
jgi:hypothetical protein